MTIKAWFECFLKGHDWTSWHSGVKSYSFSNFRYEYLDHFVERQRHCKHCGKYARESYFVPGVSTSNYTHQDTLQEFQRLVDFCKQVHEEMRDPATGQYVNKSKELDWIWHRYAGAQIHIDRVKEDSLK